MIMSNVKIIMISMTVMMMMMMMMTMTTTTTMTMTMTIMTNSRTCPGCSPADQRDRMRYAPACRAVDKGGSARCIVQVLGHCDRVELRPLG